MTMWVGETERTFGLIEENSQVETFLFTKEEPLVGIYGWNSAIYISNIGVVYYNVELCPTTSGRGTFEEEDTAVFDHFVEDEGEDLEALAEAE